MNPVTYLQSLELIDIAAQENRLYHHNGGQTYIRVSMNSNVLMIIDHAINNKVDIQLMDGAAYFEQCSGYNIEHSRRLREYGSMVDWYIKHTLLHEKDMV